MGKKSGGGDALAGAQVEGQFGIDAARNATYADRINQTNALGTNNFSNYTTIDPSTGEEVTAWRQDQTLDPNLQQIFNTESNTDAELSQLAHNQNAAVSNAYANPLDWDQFGSQTAGPAGTAVDSSKYTSDPTAFNTSANAVTAPINVQANAATQARTLIGAVTALAEV